MPAQPTVLPDPLFVADHRALDFLNSIATPVDTPVEWIGTGPHLIAWLENADLLPKNAAAKFRDSDLDKLASRARDLREWLRALVAKHAGHPLTSLAPKDLAHLNALLAEGHAYAQLARGDADHPLRLTQHQRFDTPQQLLQPLALQIADLLAHADFTLVRFCEGKACTLTFLDKTKSHKRRWCTMSLCGNRAKAAAHRARARDD